MIMIMLIIIIIKNNYVWHVLLYKVNGLSFA